MTSLRMTDLFNSPLADVDPEVADAIGRELERQQRTLEMIASENFVPLSVLECQGSVLTNKYAEGYPGRRYYGGCEHVDVIEQLAIDRAKELFGAEHANVQPHAGAQANAAAFHALMHPGDTLMGLALPHGGHLTHGMRINFSGRLYDIAAYEVDRETSLIDTDVVTSTVHKTLGGARGGLILCREEHRKAIDSAVFPGQQGGPLEHVIAGKAVALRIAQTEAFRERQARTIAGAKAVAAELLQAGHGVNVLTGGTDVHLALVDLRESDLDGRQ